MPFAELPSKPGAPLFYELFGDSNSAGNDNGDGDGDGTDDAVSNQPLIVFINGLGLPCSSWRPIVSLIQASSPPPNPRMLIYDRYAQGSTTSRDPLDSQPGKEPGYGHDLSDVVRDLEELLGAVVPATRASPPPPPLVLVAASIGVNIARLYAASHPGTVAGLVFLDSNMATVNTWLDVWPDLDAPGFDPSLVLDDDCTLNQYRRALQTMRAMFDADVKNKEGLDRRTTRTLLPDPATPKLEGPTRAKGPYLTVVGHDPETFAQEGLERIKVPKSVTGKFTQPIWQAYNEGLTRISDPDRTTGVLHAPDCGHFIQQDNPQFVADLVLSMLGDVRASPA